MYLVYVVYVVYDLLGASYKNINWTATSLPKTLAGVKSKRAESFSVGWREPDLLFTNVHEEIKGR